MEKKFQLIIDGEVIFEFDEYTRVGDLRERLEAYRDSEFVEVRRVGSE